MTITTVIRSVECGLQEQVLESGAKIVDGNILHYIGPMWNVRALKSKGPSYN